MSLSNPTDYGMSSVAGGAADPVATSSDDKLRILVDALPVGMAYVDARLRYQSSNRTYRGWFGGRAEPADGCALQTVLGESAFEDARLAYECALQGESIMFDESIEPGEGPLLELQTTLVPHRDPSGVVVGLFLLSHDVSDQKRRGDRLARSLRHLSGALDGLDTALVVLDSAACTVSDNAAWHALVTWLGAARCMPGTPYDQVFDPQRIALSTRNRHTIEAVGTSARGGIRPVREQQRWTVDGESRWLAISTSEFREGGERFVLVSHEDVTERVALEERLRAQDLAVARGSRLTALGELAATLAHELNQPLTAIGNYAALANDLVTRQGGQADPALLGDALNRLVAEVTRAGAIVHRVNRSVRRLPAPIEPIAVAGLLDDLIERHADRDGATRLVLALDPAVELPALRMDRVQLEQVLHNLVGNALEAIVDADASACVRIGAVADPADSMMQFTIEDDGPGIDAAERPAVFEPFVSSKPSGLGLGLAICRSIVESHGGWIIAEASATGGARLRFALPLEGGT